jgi:hypothetical protein
MAHYVYHANDQYIRTDRGLYSYNEQQDCYTKVGALGGEDPVETTLVGDLDGDPYDSSCDYCEGYDDEDYEGCGYQDDIDSDTQDRLRHSLDELG